MFSYAQEGYQVKHVMIDAGHGGKDPGAVGKGSKEKDITLAIALKVGEYVEKNLKGVKVSYTRDKDVFVGLRERAQKANAAKADLFISIHCNASESSKPYGTETWVMGMHRNERNLKVAQKENAAILLETDYDKTYENFDPNSPLSYIRFKIIQNEFRTQSVVLANNVQTEFTTRVKRHDRGVKEAGFLVLVYTTMPRILIEAGFLSNPAEEKFLKSKNGQELMASAIYRAIKKYKKDIEGPAKTELPVPTTEPVVTSDSSKQVVTPQRSPEQPANDDPVPPSNTKVIVAVQFSTSTRKKDLSSFKGVSDVWEYEQGGLFKYVSGHFNQMAEAEAHLAKLKSAGYTDAFLVYFLNGERIKRAEALKLLK
jgi:N-acetylmuramoyl-L-alanine amidase